MRRFLAGLAEAQTAFGGVLRNRALRRLELAWACSIVGAWAYGVAVVVYAFQHGGARAVGVVGLLRWGTAALASPFAAALGDRYDRRLVMVASDLVRAGLIVAAAAAVFAASAPWLVYVLASLVSVAGTPFRPAEAAYTPVLTNTPEELSAANVVAAAIESIGIFAGPALGGLLLAATSTGTVFVATAALVGASALLIVGIRAGAEERLPGPPGESVLRELLAGARTIASDRKVALLVGLFAAQTFVDGLLGVLIAVIALSFLDAGAAAVGWLNAASGVGGIVGAVLAGMMVGRGRLAGNFGLGVLLFGLPLALVPVWRNEGFALLLLAFIGVGNTLADVSGMTLLQRFAPDAVLARVFGVLESVLLLTVGLGAIVAPVLVSALGIRAALVVAGLLLPLLVVPTWPVLRRLDRGAVVPAHRLERLRAIPFLSLLPEATLEQLARAASEKQMKPGDEIVQQGERGDRFFVIDSGSVDVLVDGLPTKTLGPGDYFGEIALLRDVPRTATVRAREDGGLLTLTHDAFVPAVSGYSPSLASAEAVVGLRLGPARAGIVRA
ncbi:MAG TPA: MFS transporter [Gaiellaceae bacterium]|nr:MFS transporter [Gaiellaceae bacterium]